MGMIEINRHAPMRKLPAYGKQLLNARCAGNHPRDCYVVTDWALGKAFVRLVCSPDTDPTSIDWRVVAGLDVILAYKLEHASHAARIAEAIMPFVRIMNGLCVDPPMLCFLKREALC